MRKKRQVKKKKIKERTTRIDERFSNELKEIRKARLKNRMDKKKISDRRLTALIPKHKKWPLIKREIIDLSQEEIKNILKEDNFNEK
jgi:hypothetical protein